MVKMKQDAGKLSKYTYRPGPYKLMSKIIRSTNIELCLSIRDALDDELTDIYLIFFSSKICQHVELDFSAISTIFAPGRRSASV